METEGGLRGVLGDRKGVDTVSSVFRDGVSGFTPFVVSRYSRDRFFFLLFFFVKASIRLVLINN